MSPLLTYFTCSESSSSILTVPVFHLDLKSEFSYQSGLQNSNSKELHKLVDFPVSLLSAAA